MSDDKKVINLNVDGLDNVEIFKRISVLSLDDSIDISITFMKNLNLLLYEKTGIYLYSDADYEDFRRDAYKNLVRLGLAHLFQRLLIYKDMSCDSYFLPYCAVNECSNCSYWKRYGSCNNFENPYRKIVKKLNMSIIDFLRCEKIDPTSLLLRHEDFFMSDSERERLFYDIDLLKDKLDELSSDIDDLREGLVNSSSDLGQLRQGVINLSFKVDSFGREVKNFLDE